METQDDYSADFSGLLKQCTKAGIALELDNQSEDMVSDRNCRLQRGDKIAHLAGEEKQNKKYHLFSWRGTTWLSAAEFCKLLRDSS